VPGLLVGSPLRIDLTLALGAAAAALCLFLNTPLPWMIGPLLVTATGCMAGAPLVAATPLRNAGQWVIGTALGLYFTPQAVAVVLGHWAAIDLVASAHSLRILLVVLIVPFGFQFAGLHGLDPTLQLSGLHPATLLLGTSPGGIAEMCITAKVLQLGVPVVTAFHVTRMAAVVMLSGPVFRWTARGH
jgi:uncharacterized protein